MHLKITREEIENIIIAKLNENGFEHVRREQISIVNEEYGGNWDGFKVELEKLDNIKDR